MSVIDELDAVGGLDGAEVLLEAVEALLEELAIADQPVGRVRQRAAPEAHFVKAFNSVGNGLMVHPQFEDGQPTMFICGQDAGAKAEVTALLDRFGWDVEDLGGAAAARAIEPLCMLWCIPGLRENRWNHAFKLLRR